MAGPTSRIRAKNHPERNKMSRKEGKRNTAGTKKKTSIGNSKFTKRGLPGPHGGGRRYRKRYRGQGK
tara:strand:+ start:140 stop:340 length:201 start_codon:yes stop_codon:yes gene_type:complete